MQFPLSKAPELIFDAQLWEIFKSYFENPQTAIERIGFPPDATGYHSEDYEKRSGLSKESWQRIEEAVVVGRELLHGLQRKFLSRELMATGIHFGFLPMIREPIPPEKWQTLWPNFSGNWAMSTVERYEDIQCSYWPKDPEIELQYQCEAFFEKRKKAGESTRKVLIEELTNHLGMAVPIRVFNNAYHNVFQKKRGRPPGK